jgi:hypothetical protein
MKLIMEAWTKHLKEIKGGDAVAATRKGAEELGRSGISDEERQTILSLSKKLTAIAQRADINQGPLGARIELVGREIEEIMKKLGMGSSEEPPAAAPEAPPAE